MLGCLIIARLSSTRLPNKNILTLNNIPMIINLFNRIKKSKTLDKIIICTSIEKTDNLLEKIANEHDVPIFRGDLENIMDRIIKCASKYNLTDIVEVLGDNPLIDHTLIDYVSSNYFKKKLDYCTNISQDYKKQLDTKPYKCFPIGLRVQIYKTSVAQQYTKFTKESFISSHPTNFIFENNKLFKNEFLEAKNDFDFLNLSNLTFAVNEKNQFDNIRNIFENFKSYNFTLKEMVNFINEKKIDLSI